MRTMRPFVNSTVVSDLWAITGALLRQTRYSCFDIFGALPAEYRRSTMSFSFMPGRTTSGSRS